MLSLAIKAKIPVIRATTTDLINLMHVIRHLCGEKINVYEIQGSSMPYDGEVVVAVNEFKVKQADYDSLVSEERVLVLINQGADSPFVFEAGEVPVPRDMMEALLAEVVPPKRVQELMPCFNGMTLKGMYEVIKLASAQEGALTAKSITQVRSTLTGKLQGLAQVDTAMALYLCNDQLDQWVQKNKPYFLEGKDDRLVPRGILLNGDPGVGKSQGAKYIANEFGVPLYRLDLSTALSKWVSESEANFSRVLTALDTEEPAILLVDEVEKQFSETQDEGITARLLSQFLWWLQEHKSRVLTVMTTNNVLALPKELYRAGRINKVISISRCNVSEARQLSIATLRQFIKTPKGSHLEALRKALKERGTTLSHAEVVETVIDLIKERGWVN